MPVYIWRVWPAVKRRVSSSSGEHFAREFQTPVVSLIVEIDFL
jgi:hypothetical protein